MGLLPGSRGKFVLSQNDRSQEQGLQFPTQTKGKTLEQVDDAFNDNTGEEEQQVMQMLAAQGRLGTNGTSPAV